MDFLTTWYSTLPFKVQVYYGLAVFFLLTSLSFVLFILISQYLKSARNRKRKKYQEVIQNEISILVVQTTMVEIPDAAFQFKLHELMKLANKSDFLGQLILDEILSMKKNLVGESATYLIKAYQNLGLLDLSVNKVKSRSWKRIAKGLREFETMEQVDSLHYFIKYLNHPNYYLRREARLSLAGLAPNPMFFLDDFEEALSEWEQLLLFQKLKRRPKEVIPDFSRWYQHKNTTVVSFCIEMTEQFGQVENISKLEKLLPVAKSKIACMMLGALQRMEAIQCIDTVVHLLKHTNSFKVVVSCLQFIGSVGSEAYREVLAPYAAHYNPIVCLEAVRALQDMGCLEKGSSPKINAMIDHVSHPLLT